MNWDRILFTGPLVLVNSSHPIAQEPEPAELAPADRRYPNILLHARAAALLNQLLQAVGGQQALLPVSGYRPRAEQQAIWEDTVRERGESFARTYVARPGCSEHQTGLAIDLGENVPGLDFITPSFPDTGVCRRFRLRAAHYGFVLRYPAGKEPVTGIGYEPWHFRYVGWPHARIMEERGLVLEEYLAWLRDFPEEGPRLRCRTGGRTVEVCYIPADRLEGLEDRLPAGIHCQCSGADGGGVALTLWRDAG